MFWIFDSFSQNQNYKKSKAFRIFEVVDKKLNFLKLKTILELLFSDTNLPDDRFEVSLFKVSKVISNVQHASTPTDKYGENVIVRK